MVQAPAPARLIAGELRTEATVAQDLVSKSPAAMPAKPKSMRRPCQSTGWSCRSSLPMNLIQCALLSSPKYALLIPT